MSIELDGIDRTLSVIYPLQIPHRTRDRPMQVLALGLPRSGTDSLRHALEKLGYRGIYHAYVCMSQADDCAFWVPAMRAKYRGDVGKLNATEFDRVLGNFQAVTDTPCCIFGEELIAAYPDAKVIVNRRRNVDAWFNSMNSTAIALFNPFLWTCKWFQGDLFWLQHTFYIALVTWAKGDFKKHGKEACVEHYQKLEQYLKSRDKKYLEWAVEDGWEPLCQFLEKPVPSEPFPRGNAAGREFDKNMEAAIGRYVKTGLLRLGITVTVVVAVATGFIMNRR